MDHLDGRAVRRSPARHQAGSDRPQDQEARARRQVVSKAHVRIAFFGTPAFAVPTLERSARAPRHEVVLVVTQPDRPRGRGQQVSAGPVKQLADARGIPVRQPDKLTRDPWEAEFAAFRHRPRRRRRLRQDPAGLAARPAAARPHQRACVAAAALSRRLAHSSRRHGRRRRNRRDDHARREGARRRRDAGHGHACRSAPTIAPTWWSASWPRIGGALLVEHRRSHWRRARSTRCRRTMRMPPTRRACARRKGSWTGRGRRARFTTRFAACIPGRMPSPSARAGA